MLALGLAAADAPKPNIILINCDDLGYADIGPFGVKFSQLHALDLADIDGDGLLDIITGNKKGAFVHLHSVKNVTKKQWQAAQPKRVH